MARNTPAGLGALLGSPGSHSMGGVTNKLPWWAKLALIAGAVLLAWALTENTAQLITLVAFGTMVCVACYRDYRLTLIVIVTLVFAVLLSATKAGPGMVLVGGGVTKLGETGADAVGNKVQTQVGNAPTVQVGVQPATTTTAPAPTPAVAPPQP